MTATLTVTDREPSTPGRVVRRPWLRWARPHRTFVFVFLFVLFDSLFWMGAIPAYQTPDEPDHMVYIDRLSQQSPFRPTLLDPSYSRALEASVARTRANAMFHQPQVKGTFDSDVRTANERLLRETSDRDLTEASPTFTRASSIPPFHYWINAQYYRLLSSNDTLRNIFLPRMFSLLLTLSALVLQYGAYRIYFRDEQSRLLALFVTALMPMYVFMHNAPNPDVTVMTLYSGFLYLALRAIRDRCLGWPANLGLAAITAAGLLTKQTFAIVLPAYVVLALTLLIMTRRWRRVLIQGITYGGSIVALAGAYYLGSKNVNNATGAVYSDLPQLMTLPQYLDWGFSGRYLSIVDEFWGVFGWLDVALTPRTFDAIHVLLLVAAIGVVTAAVRALIRWRIDPLIPTMLSSVVALVVLIGVIDFAHVSTGIEPNGFAQGRYFLPVVPVLVMLLVKGLTGWIHADRIRTVVMLALVPAFATLHVVALAQIVLPRYYL